MIFFFAAHQNASYSGKRLRVSVRHLQRSGEDLYFCYTAVGQQSSIDSGRLKIWLFLIKALSFYVDDFSL